MFIEERLTYPGHVILTLENDDLQQFPGMGFGIFAEIIDDDLKGLSAVLSPSSRRTSYVFTHFEDSFDSIGLGEKCRSVVDNVIVQTTHDF